MEYSYVNKFNSLQCRDNIICSLCSSLWLVLGQYTVSCPVLSCLLIHSFSYGALYTYDSQPVHCQVAFLWGKLRLRFCLSVCLSVSTLVSACLCFRYEQRCEHEIFQMKYFNFNMFTCFGWQVTLCDPIWQVTPPSSRMGFSSRALFGFSLNFLLSTSALRIFEISNRIEQLLQYSI